MDKLNCWEYCNPSNFNDRLPKPYRYLIFQSQKFHKQAFEYHDFK
ncbi:unnamed protein product (macronuclear) [Paramecium tetraurelia]|uniref:Uncharacterized protein n=1 Tax=Paramecium tetraurelia TaxID=5888 RepID=A0DAE5_PARTE|nr:uncharacterized protein GSPATT00014919001 [Paramecium tetraurelia]CAK80012.1 unnamed protein product [Paramecium tetraurelia]|eukprot:XP_001447409.1 hypothetical protein (macronuclear) [Paramecium tetraurelia strain d4-2]